MRPFIMQKTSGVISLVLFMVILFYISVPADAFDLHTWSGEEMKTLRSLWIGSLPPPPADPSNAYADNPKAIALGKKIFFDGRFSGNLQVSCGTCHPPNENFADMLPLAHGMGTTTRRTMPLIGAAYSTWLFWDGRKDSLWAQALGPLESPVEHGFSRTQSVVIISKYYLKDYEEIFGALPPELLEHELPAIAKPSLDDPEALKAWILIPKEKREALNRIYANMGKAIAAFVRTILPQPSRFDTYVDAILHGKLEAAQKTFSNDEAKGLRLFIGKAKCTNCHNGPLFTNGQFHNIGVPQPSHLPPDRGRADGIVKVLSDEFNCLGVYSDAGPGECGELRFINVDAEKYTGAFKVPTLRNVAERAPYMHAGQFATLHDVLEFYRQLKAEQRKPELEHGGLNDAEMSQLEAFRRTLSGPLKYE